MKKVLFKYNTKKDKTKKEIKSGFRIYMCATGGLTSKDGNPGGN